MTFLYNCKHDGDQFRISKFNSEDMNVESSYLCTETECNCPAGVRPTCRHRSMLPKFIKRGYIGTEFFFDFDRGGWVQGAATPDTYPPEGQMFLTSSTAEPAPTHIKRRL